ncbi:MAG: sporulation integral membrane protein YtvI [Eubacteriales bacterium]|nr:sporulation integral membrane protein YtvI [Eubacteriales bacterium]
MKLEKRRSFIINFLYFAIILGIIILLTRYALGAIAPFLIAFAVSFLLKPAVHYFCEKLRIPRGISGLVLVVLFYALLGFLFTVIGVQLFSAAKSFFLTLPSLYTGSVAPWMSRQFALVQEFVGKLDPEATAAYNALAASINSSLGNAITGISRQVVAQVTSVTLKAPGFLLKLLITVIATVFLTIDFPKIKAFVMRQLTPRIQDLFHNARVQLGRTLWSYTRSYALILAITFAELALGLTLIGIPNALGIAVLIALFDILPVVGSGLVLLPWTVYTLLTGNLMRGIGLAVLYVVVIVVRQIMEPKIVGDRVGLHPLVTLLCMVLGTYLFGGIGLLGLPIAVALIHALNKQGVIHLYKLSDDPEADEKGKNEPSSTSQETAAAPDVVPEVIPPKKQRNKAKKS